MREAKFTKGGWRAVIEDKQPQPMYSGLIALISNGGSGYKAVVAEARYVSPQEWEANAHLIAAAPELYEVLNRLLELWSDNEVRSVAFSDAIEAAANLLEKARGEQS